MLLRSPRNHGMYPKILGQPAGKYHSKTKPMPIYSLWNPNPSDIVQPLPCLKARFALVCPLFSPLLYSSVNCVKRQYPFFPHANSIPCLTHFSFEVIRETAQKMRPLPTIPFDLLTIENPSSNLHLHQPKNSFFQCSLLSLSFSLIYKMKKKGNRKRKNGGKKVFHKRRQRVQTSIVKQQSSSTYMQGLEEYTKPYTYTRIYSLYS